MLNGLPQTNSITFADRISLACFTFTSLAFLLGVLNERLHSGEAEDQKRLASEIDRAARLGFPALFLGLNVWCAVSVQEYFAIGRDACYGRTTEGLDQTRWAHHDDSCAELFERGKPFFFISCSAVLAAHILLVAGVHRGCVHSQQPGQTLV